MRKIAFIVAATLGLALAFAPVAGKAAPAAGAFAPSVEENVVPVVCVRKSSGRIACGYYDPYGNFHETGEGYRGGPYGPYGGQFSGQYGGGCICITKSSGRVACGVYDRFGAFHETPACYR